MVKKRRRHAAACKFRGEQPALKPAACKRLEFQRHCLLLAGSRL